MKNVHHVQGGGRRVKVRCFVQLAGTSPTQGFVRFQAVEEAKAAIEGIKAAAEGGKVLICGAESELTVLEGDTSLYVLTGCSAVAPMCADDCSLKSVH